MDIFLPSIKQKYKDRLINREKQWPLCHSNKLVRLELVEREKGKGYCDNRQRGSDDKTVKRTSLAYGDLFKVESGKRPVRKILVEGDAGIGKTTLSVSISEDWSCEKLFKEFELVLLLPLRHKKVASAGSLPELLKLLHPSSDVCKSVASYLEKEEAKKVLVIADGWDELSESERQEGSFLYELLFETFPFMSVVVTSRPSASAPLHRLSCIDRFVEINGFGKDDIKEYIHCEFSSEHEKACRLLERLEDNPLVESVCSVPLNCAIVCHLWRISEEALPFTMTQLYTKIILNVIFRNIRKIDSITNVVSLPSFKALPNELQQSFRLLCKFAFEALKNNQIVFSQEELVKFFPEGLALDEKILCFGLLQCAETVLETGFGVSFHFLHLTFMEYLAALHLSGQPQSTLLDIFSGKVSDPFGFQFDFSNSRFNIMWRFFFGISFSGLKDGTEDIRTNALEYVRKNNKGVSLCHYAFESQNYIISRETAQLLQNRMYWFEKSYCNIQTAHDFSAVLHVMAEMERCTSCIRLLIGHCGVKENQIRRLTDILAGKQGKLRIVELDLSGNKLTGDCVIDLFHRASAAFKPDEDYDHGGDLSPYFAIRLSINTGLTHINLSDIPLGASKLELLKNFVCHKIFPSLGKLSLTKCFTSDADTNDTSLTTFIEALFNNCPHLWNLDLSSNNLGVAGASAVAKGLSKCFHVTDDSRDDFGEFELWLDDCSLGDEGLKAFVSNLDGVYNINELSFCSNSIHADGISYLTKAVRSKKIKLYIGTISLNYNSLELEGIVAVHKMLSCGHSQFDGAELSRCEVTAAKSSFSNSLGNSMSSETAIIKAGQQLCQMPKNNTTTHLDLSGNSFTGEGIHILIGIMHQCVSLEGLFCNNCGITSDDLILLLDKLCRLKTPSSNFCNRLSMWDLSNNIIDDRGALALINYVSSLFEYDGIRFDTFGPVIDGNPVSIETSERLYGKVERIMQLKVSYSD